MEQLYRQIRCTDYANHDDDSSEYGDGTAENPEPSYRICSLLRAPGLDPQCRMNFVIPFQIVLHRNLFTPSWTERDPHEFYASCRVYSDYDLIETHKEELQDWVRTD